MFATVLQELKGYFGRSFLLAVFFPVLFFVGSSLVIYLEITYGLGTAITMLGKLPLFTQTLLLLSALAAIATLAYLVANFQYSINQLFAGYWPHLPLFNNLRGWCTHRHIRRWHSLAEQAQLAIKEQRRTEAGEIWAKQTVYYPPRKHLDRMMPTHLGNILRAAEFYAYDRYGIDATIIWLRLRILLKPEIVVDLEDKKISMDFMLLTTLLSALFTLVWSPVLAIFFAHQWKLFLLCLIGLPIAWLAYQNAIQAAIAYSEQVKAVFDLYRFDLLKALNRPLPSDTLSERVEWDNLTQFFYRNLPLEPASSTPEQLSAMDRLANAVEAYLRTLTSHETEDDQ